MARVLMADDSAVVRTLVQMVLERAGHEVVSACDGAEALRAVATSRPDLVLVDLAMPGLSGLDVVRALRAGPGTRVLPVVLLSAEDTPRVIEAAFVAGCDEYLVKPLRAPELLAVVQRLAAVAA
jgi:CheY-like chemotaxis protein